LAASPTAEHAATLLDGHARLREASAFIAGTVPHREKHGGGRIAYDRWGPRVRKFFYLDSNSGIVTKCHEPTCFIQKMEVQEGEFRFRMLLAGPRYKRVTDWRRKKGRDRKSSLS